MLNFNNLIPAQTERLALLLEECGEAIQAIGKILRHGYNSSHPNLPKTTNKDDLEKEIGHIKLAISLLCDAGDISYDSIAVSTHEKSRSIIKYLHHQNPLETKFPGLRKGRRKTD